MVCVVYASSMMSLLIRIQLNVIGGYIYLQNNNTSTQSNEVCLWNILWLILSKVQCSKIDMLWNSTTI